MMRSGTRAPEEPATNARQRKVVAAQNVSRMCLVCGRSEPVGPPRPLLRAGGPGPAAEAGGAHGAELLGVFTLREEHQSYPGRLHGGIATAILDETIGRAITIADPGVWGVTAELTVRFRKPLPVDGELRAWGASRATRDDSSRAAARSSSRDGSVAAEATGKYLKMGLGEITDDDFDQRDWFPDVRPAPGGVDL